MTQALREPQPDGNVTPFGVRRLATALGAEVTGLDLTQELNDATIAALRNVLLENEMMVIRGQQAMTPQHQLDFASRFGPISIHPYVPSIEGFPGVMKVYAIVPVTQAWHADSTHRKDPPAITFLLPRILPEIGGDTMFASATRAFEQLSDGLRETLLRLRAVHVGTESLAGEAGLTREQVTATHPVIRTHSETGKQALFVNGDYTTHFEGWTEKESRPLLEHLFAWVGRVENVYRHRWQAGDLVIWDNHATQHAVVGDTYGAERMLDRVTVSRPAA